MLNQEVKERFYTHPNISRMSVGKQFEVLQAFQEVLEEQRKENPDESLSELFTESAKYE